MLVLSRNIGQSLHIFCRGANIKVQIVDSSALKARIGIELPSDAKVLREELIGHTPVDDYGCVGSTIALSDGRLLDLVRPDIDMITIEEIANAISNTCRFGGRVWQFYSVAEHCFLAAKAAAFDGCLLREVYAVLMHDAAEAFVGDIVKPIKIMLGDSYATIEATMMDAIDRKFGVDFHRHCDVIKKYDRAMLFAEKKFHFPNSKHSWIGEENCDEINVQIECYSPSFAYAEFVHFFENIVRDMEAKKVSCQ